MKNLSLLLLLSSLWSCSALQTDSLMTELNQSKDADELRMKSLGLTADKGAGIEFIDPADRLLLQENFDCGKTKEKIAYCRISK